MEMMTNNPRALFAVAAAAAVLFVMTLLSQHTEHKQRVTTVLSETASKAWPFGGEKTSYDIAKEEVTGKVTEHSYQNTHDMYIPAFRKRRVKLL